MARTHVEKTIMAKTKQFTANTIPILIDDNPKLKAYVHSSQGLDEVDNPALILDLKIPNTKFFLRIKRLTNKKNKWDVTLTDTETHKPIIKSITTQKLLLLLDNLVERIETNNKNQTLFYRNMDKCAQLIINIINSKVYKRKAVRRNFATL